MLSQTISPRDDIYQATGVCPKEVSENELEVAALRSRRAIQEGKRAVPFRYPKSAFFQVDRNH